jgi:predicted Zn-dependent protease with MMP-like domain
MIRLNRREFDALVAKAVTLLPEQFRTHMENLSIEVLPRPTREMLDEEGFGPEDEQELMGLYVGVPLTEKSVNATYEWPEQIYLFQDNIQAACDTPGQVVKEIRATVLHEIAHHFGFDDDELDKMGLG